MDNIKTFAIIGCGGRGREAYGNAILNLPDRAKVVAVAELDPEKRAYMARVHGISPENCFATAEELLSRPRLADAVVVATQDRQHVDHAIPAMELGYHVLLEKPVSPSREECLRLLEVSRRTGRKVVVAHVLRYSPLYRKVKQILDSGVLGRLITVQGVENIGYWHFAHSYVRGNWRREDETSPMLLAKCCHDMDIIVWLTGKKCLTVSSFGQLTWFRPENAPAGAAHRCSQCPIREGCPYDAEKIYLTNKATGLLGCGNTQWPVSILALEPTEEKLRAAIAQGPYGRCVYHCDNDVADHQIVNLQLEDGITVTYTASAFTDAVHGRHIRFMCAQGEVIMGGDQEYRIRVQPFGKEPQDIDLNWINSVQSGHAGGDSGLVREFLDLLEGEEKEGITSLDVSLESHFICFAAEQSRLNDGRSIPMSQIWGDAQ